MKKWKGLFLIVLSKYNLSDHVLSDDNHPGQANWDHMDCTMITWIYGTITYDLLDTVMLPNTTARDVWVSLKGQILGNKESRALHLEVEFHTFVQGNLLITDYARKLKTMVDSLVEF